VKAIAIVPGTTTLRVVERPAPAIGAPDEVVLRVLSVGICGTDRDIIAGFYGDTPEDADFLVLGHESLSRVARVGRRVHEFKKGDLVVPTVRRELSGKLPQL
jgi:threonine dehydrogenase-like Zn-dependent dehydrogenase